MRVPSTDDVSLELHDLGGDGPQLLIAHATGFCAGAYRPLAAALEQRFHVWALDFRAHGLATSPAGGDLTWRGMADDVLAVADVLADRATGDGAPRPGLLAVGHSMGGAALMAAERRRPGTLRSAYLFEPIIVPPGFGSEPGGNAMADSARRRRPSFPSRAEALARYAGRPPLGIFRADALAAYVEHGFDDAEDGTVTLRCTPEHEAEVFEASAKPLISDMADVATPTVVATGSTAGGPGPAHFAAAVADALPNGRVVRHEHLSHFGPFQDPDAIARDIVETFVAG